MKPIADILEDAARRVTRYIVCDPRTQMLLATKERPRNVRIGSGFGQDYKWVRKVEEAEPFGCYSDAELPTIFLNLRHFEIRPLLSCGLLGAPVDRDQAIANDTFHSAPPRQAATLARGDTA